MARVCLGVLVPYPCIQMRDGVGLCVRGWGAWVVRGWVSMGSPVMGGAPGPCISGSSTFRPLPRGLCKAERRPKSLRGNCESGIVNTGVHGRRRWGTGGEGGGWERKERGDMSEEKQEEQGTGISAGR